MSVALSSALALLVKEGVLPKLLGPSRVIQDLVALALLLILLLVPL